MTPDRYRRAGEIYHAALELKSSDRGGFLDGACGSDEELRREVESLLDAHERAGNFLASPAVEIAAGLLAEEKPPSLAGKQIHHYRVLSLLGAGGMGEVYLAQDARLGRKVALKWLPAELTTDADRLRRFEQEARAASALNHPNIVTIHDVGSAENGRFIVMELVEGRTLRAMLAEGAAPADLVRIGEQMAGALTAAHAAGIVHRDIKPENIMVRADGYVKVLDFGLARLQAMSDPIAEAETEARTDPGALLGTLKYMSPEQARGEAVSPSSDVFSLGLVFYEMATGTHPFASSSHLRTLNAIVSQTPLPARSVNADLHPALDALIVRMLAKDGRLRPSAAEVAAALQDLGRRGETTSERTVVRSSDRHTVGHEKERAELRSALSRAAAGRGSLLGLVGEPGIGKTTLVEDFLAELAVGGETHLVARGRSSERLAGTEAYLPWLEILESLNAEPSAAEAMKALAPTWFLQLSSGGSDSSSERLFAEQALSQERMKRELRAFFQSLAQQRPLVLFLDDLHWADVSTIDLLAFLADRLPSMAALVVTTYRPSDMVLAKHPFLRLKPDLQARGVYREIPLGFLGREDIDRYLALEFPEHRFPADLSAMIHVRTEGSPLFMADLVRYLRARKVLTQEDGSWVLAGSLPEIENELPESVRGMIERKVGQLSDSDRGLLIAASVQGVEFDSAVLARVLDTDAAAVEERLDILDRVYAFVKLVSERELPDRRLTLRYRFVHVLYQNALYGSLRPTRRAQMAVSVARAIESLFGEESASMATELAALYEEAREYALAAEWFQKGAERANQLFATQESLQLARRGISMAEKLPEGLERGKRELSLRIALGNTLIAAMGYAAPEVERNYSRALDLCRQLGETPHRLPVLCGLCFYHNTKGQYRRAMELGDEFLELAGRRNDPALVVAHRMAGNPRFFLGELSPAREHYERALALYDPPQHRSLTWLYGAEPGMNAAILLAAVLWLQGYPDRAGERTRQARQIADEVSHANTRGYALSYEGMNQVFRRDWKRVHEIAESLVPLATEQGLAMWQGYGRILRGRAIAEEEARAAEGAGEIRQGLDAVRALGAELNLPLHFSLLAEACARAGRIAEGLGAIEQGLSFAEKNEERYWEGELHRLRGELLLQRGVPASEVELSFRRAAEISRNMGARSLELRAAMSLARLWQKQEKREDARRLLTDVYGTFTEGFGTRDLQDARALLAELAPKEHTVGREKERAELRAAFDSVAAGPGLLLSIAGEPGIGKTTLVEGFLSELRTDGRPCWVGRGNCSERLAGSEAFRPLLDALESLLRGEPRGAAENALRRLAPCWYAQIHPLSSETDSDARDLAAAQGVSPERMKRELRAFFHEVSAQRPAVLFFDDLQWADLSTIGQIAWLASHFRDLRLLIVACYRPSEMLLARHPFLGVRLDLQARGTCRDLALDFLSVEDIERYLTLEFAENRFPEELSRSLHARTEGSPLFMTDLVRYLRDRRVIAQEDGHWMLTGSLREVEPDLPESVRGMIERKIAALEEDDQRALAAASVQGYEFDSVVVAELLELDPAGAEERLESLERIHGFLRLAGEREFPDSALTQRYRFVHALYQNALYGSLGPARRAQWSRGVAEALIRHIGAKADEVALELANLFEAAREFEKAVDFFSVAAEKAARVFAYQETAIVARRGMALLEKLPESSERDRRELRLLKILGPALFALSGYAAPEGIQLYARARELSERRGDVTELFTVLYDTWLVQDLRGDLESAREVAQHCLRLAETSDDSRYRMMAHAMLGETSLWRGEFSSARSHYFEASRSYDFREPHALALLHGGYDPGVAVRSIGAHALWYLGCPDQALRESRLGLSRAEESSHPHTLALALCHASFLHHLRRERRQARERAESALELSIEQGLPFWTSYARILRGRTLVDEGKTSEGLTEIVQGIADYRAKGSELEVPFFTGLFTEAAISAGRRDEGLRAIDVALAHCEKNGVRFHVAELLRLRGELLESAGREEEAEGFLRRAGELAREQGAKALELRAAMSRLRLAAKRGDEAEAREELRTVYRGFTEGQDTPDLIEARALLNGG